MCYQRACGVKNATGVTHQIFSLVSVYSKSTTLSPGWGDNGAGVPQCTQPVYLLLTFLYSAQIKQKAPGLTFPTNFSQDGAPCCCYGSHTGCSAWIRTGTLLGMEGWGRRDVEPGSSAAQQLLILINSSPLKIKAL